MYALMLLLTFAMHDIEAQKTQSELPDPPSFFTQVNEDELSPKLDRALPKDFLLFHLDLSAFNSTLAQAPMEFTGREDELAIALPMPDGSTQRFTLLESPIVEPGFAAKYPQFKTYRGQGIDDPTATMRMSMTHHGMTYFIMYAGGAVYAEPVHKRNASQYMVYEASKEVINSDFTCQAHEHIHDHGHDDEGDAMHSASRSQTNGLRTLRCALTARGEWSVEASSPNPANKADASAALVAALNTINNILEREINLRLLLIANNDNLIYLDPNTDPFVVDTVFLQANQVVTDSIIGQANYDIGHLVGYSTITRGFAALDGECRPNLKARGYSQASSTTGTSLPWLMTHELGHQFSGYHPFQNRCGTNGSNPPHTVELGSGFTMLSYAGVCAPNVIQEPRLLFYNGQTLPQLEIISCYDLISNLNDPPVIDEPLVDRTIPKSTPFFITTEASDPDGDGLTYEYTQMDAELTAQPPLGTFTEGPSFRLYYPSSDKTRYFPALDSLVQGTISDWEVLPEVARDLNFRATVRDNSSEGGRFDKDDVTYTVDATAGPFEVTSQNQIGGIYTSGAPIVVTWNVAGTNNPATVNCQSVKIYCITENTPGLGFLIAENVPNDGSHIVKLPLSAAGYAKIAVVSEDNSFFNVSDEYFSILPPSAFSCSNAVHITCGESVSGDTQQAIDLDQASPCGTGVDFGAGFWHWTVGTGDIMTVSTNNPGTNFDTEIQVWTGSCDNLTCLGGTDDNGGGLASTLWFHSSPDSIYYIYVDGHASNAGVYQLSLDCVAANDVQADAIEIDCDMMSIDGITTNATSIDEPDDCGTLVTAPGVWYKLQGNGKTTTLDLCQSQYDSKISVYEDTGSSLNCLVGADDNLACNGPYPIVEFLAELGKNYMIYVHGYQSETGTFSLNIACTCPTLTNDYRSSPIAVDIADSTCSFFTVPMDCASVSGINAACDQDTNNLDLWYTFVAPTTGALAYEYQTTGFIPSINIWNDTTGSPGDEFVCITNDNIVDTIYGLIPGKLYYLQFWENSGFESAFDICLTAGECFSLNETYNGSTSLDNLDTITSYFVVNMQCAAASGINALCDTVGDNLDKWYTFIAPPSGKIRYRYQTDGFIPSINIWSNPATNGNPGDEFTCVLNDNVSDIIDGLTPGQQYYLQFWENSGYESYFEVSIEAVYENIACGSVIDYPAGTGDYTANDDALFVICPDGTDPVSIKFTHFDLEQYFDWVEIFDGATFLGSYSSLSVDTVFTASPDSCLILNFTSDGSVQSTGFTFEVSCGDCPQTLTVNGMPEAGTYKAEDMLSSDALIQSPNAVIFRAGNKINLNANFEVELGAELDLLIEPCSD